ncbi:MAG: alpha/beta fold hydrolase [Rhizobiaceae bacterium]
MGEEFNDSEGWEKFSYSASDGLRLAGRKYGWGNQGAIPVVCLAGLTRNSADFHGLAMYLAYKAEHRRKVLCLDYRGRGMSARDSDWANYNIWTEADDVIAGMIAAGFENATIIGTSRGGLIIHLLAAMRPALMSSVIFNDIGPEIDGRGLVRIKKYLENAADPENWQGAIDFVSSGGKSQFPEYNQEDWDRQARVIFEEKNGRIVTRFDKRLALGLTNIDLDNPLPSLWPQFRGLDKHPMMLIHGENSDLITSATISKMKELHPRMARIKVPKQGHAPDLASENLPLKIAEFLASQEKMAG